MLGVDIESVWQQGSLIAAPSVGPKKSKYTVPIDQNHPSYQQRMQQQSLNPADYHRPDFGPSREDYSERLNNTDRAEFNPHNLGYPPISAPVQMGYGPSGYGGQSPPISAPAPMYEPRAVMVPVQNPEIPILKEALTQQSNNVSDCQKDLYYLKVVIQQLKKELAESKHKSHDNHQKSWSKVLWMLFIVLILVIVLIILAQVSQKLNKILKQPLVSNFD